MPKSPHLWLFLQFLFIYLFNFFLIYNFFIFKFFLSLFYYFLSRKGEMWRAEQLKKFLNALENTSLLICIPPWHRAAGWQQESSFPSPSPFPCAGTKSPWECCPTCCLPWGAQRNLQINPFSFLPPLLLLLHRGWVNKVIYKVSESKNVEFIRNHTFFYR